MSDGAHRTLALMLGTLLIAAVLGCVQQAPPELLRAVEDLERELESTRSVEFAPAEYRQFARHWVAFQKRLQFEEDVIRWPWEPNRLALDLQQIHEEGVHAVAVATRRREADRIQAQAEVTRLEDRVDLLTAKSNEVGGRLVLGQRPVKTDLLIRQAQAFLDAAQYRRAVDATRQASRLVDEQTSDLRHVLHRYADPARLAVWRQMVNRTIEWSRAHEAVSIVISKAERRLTVYRSGRPLATFPIRLGFNGILEKRRQGDGATPEGHYRVISKRDRGQTQFYRALLIDYPNAEDRRRFGLARKAQTLPPGARIGGAIEIHGLENEGLSATLGCVMLENAHMDRVFEASAVGTRVAIVGAVDEDNPVALALGELTTSPGAPALSEASSALSPELSPARPNNEGRSPEPS